jgi:hypothetical protein
MDIFRRLTGLFGRKNQGPAAEQRSARPIANEAQSDGAPRWTRPGEPEEIAKRARGAQGARPDLVIDFPPVLPSRAEAQKREESPRAEARGQPPEPQPTVEAVPGASDIVRQICTETLAARSHPDASIDLNRSPRWIALKSEAPALQVAVAWSALHGEQDRNSPYYGKSLEHGQPRRAIFQAALLKNLPFQPEQILELLQDCLKHNLAFDGDYSGPLLIGAVERLATRQALPPEILSALRVIKYLAREPYRHYADVINLADRIEGILSLSLPQQGALLSGHLGEAALKWLDTLNPDEREPWLQFLLGCAEARNKSKPSAKWLKKIQQMIERIGKPQVGPRLCEMLDTVEDYGETLKGLIWATTLMDHGTVAGHVGRIAEMYAEGPNGSAALRVLSEMVGEPRAAAELFRLREKIKKHGVRKLIDRRLTELAQKRNTTVVELEDVSLPTFGLDEGSCLTVKFGDARVDLTVVPTGVVQKWTNADGKPVKSVPAEVREKFARELSAYRQQAKDIEAARQVQALRLEGSWAEERGWSFSDWEEHFLRHPLRRPIVRALIWQIGGKAVMPDAGDLKDVTGAVRSFAPQDQVRLWHPLQGELPEVLAWRGQILEHGLTQPIKQAHREIYVLTDAERATRTYSNRFAAHILRQHQLRAVCQARGWRYSLQGDWDGWNLPTRTLARQGMSAEYHIEIVEEERDIASSGIARHVSSDQVRFLDADHQPVPLESIVPIVFSEVMRDVDLFVAVTSVANDPNWTDGGPNGNHGGYWREWAFGDLGQTGAMRRELARWLVPKLSIADRLELTDKFLVVQGKRQKYAIHFGSSSIQILPSNRYLCIVPDREPREMRDIKLPFEGDSLLSAILSKAFLLVDESKIQDEAILRQL